MVLVRPWPLALLCIVASLGTAALPLRIALLVELAILATATMVLQGAVGGTILCGICAFLTVALVRRTIEFRRREAAFVERAHLAREVHDVLAHSLAALQFQLQLAVRLAPTEGALSQALVRAEHLARDGADEVRRAVASLRGDAFGPDAMPRLVEQFHAATGIACELLIEGSPRRLDAERRLTLYRTTQEALANVAKHGTAPVTVHLRYIDGLVELRVENARVGDPAANGGYGLIGLAERAAFVGGTLDAAPTIDGFRLRLRVPT